MLRSARENARYGLILFLIVLSMGSACLEYADLILSKKSGHFLIIYMWWVGTTSLLARLIRRESPRDISLRWGGWAGTRAILIATALPIAVGLAAYGTAWTMGLVEFSAAGIPSTMLAIPIRGSPPIRFYEYLLVSLTIGALWSSKSAAGEELGWRGYLLTRLVVAGCPSPIFVSGLIWALWHLPPILGGQYGSVPNSVLSISLFIGNIVIIGYVFAWLRLSSGSGLVPFFETNG